MSTYIVRTWSTDKNYGKALNDFISLIPNADDIVVITDGDVMFLTPDFGKHIEEITEANPSTDIFGCMMNRIGVPEQRILQADYLYNESDINIHFNIANNPDFMRNNIIRTMVKPTNGPIAAACMWFRRSVWDQVKFKENSIRFDMEFTFEARKKGFKLGIAPGLYVFHLYRWGSSDPANDYKHLLK